MIKPAFNLQALQARISALQVKPPIAATEGYSTIQRRDTERNNRVTMQSIVEEQEIDSHELDTVENDSFFESFEQ